MAVSVAAAVNVVKGHCDAFLLRRLMWARGGRKAGRTKKVIEKAMQRLDSFAEVDL
jgi:hypothetical protein